MRGDETTAANESVAAEAVAAEAIRLHTRYTVEVVEAFGFCPFARGAREQGEVERHALLQQDEDPEPTLALLSSLEARKGPPICIAIYPRLALAPRGFDAFAATVKAADQARHGGRPLYVSATFHPDYPLDARTPASLVPYLRRSPHPSLQLVRLSVLEAVRGSGHGTFVFDYSPASWKELERRVKVPSLEARIAADNLVTVERTQPTIEAAYAALQADREASEARLARLSSSDPVKPDQA